MVESWLDYLSTLSWLTENVTGHFHLVSALRHRETRRSGRTEDVRIDYIRFGLGQTCSVQSGGQSAVSREWAGGGPAYLRKHRSESEVWWSCCGLKLLCRELFWRWCHAVTPISCQSPVAAPQRPARPGEGAGLRVWPPNRGDGQLSHPVFSLLFWFCPWTLCTGHFPWK